MPRLGTVIRDTYRRPGADALPAHLEAHYGIRVAAASKLDTGVFRIGRHDGPPWVARMFLTSRPLARTEEDAEVLRFIERRQFPAERCAHPEPVSTLDGRAILVTTYVALLHTAGPRHAGDVLAGYQAHVALTADEFDRLEGVLWMRPLWLAAWQCWLAVVSPEVSRIFVPDPDYIAALAREVRDIREPRPA